MALSSSQISAWITDPRFAPFLAAKNGSVSDATALYEWHAAASGACFATLHHFEVLLRNTIDGTLAKGQPDSPLSTTWLKDPAVLSVDAINIVGQVERRLIRESKPADRPHVIAAMSFGFWKSLFYNHYEPLWVARLNQGFPGQGLRNPLLRQLTNLHLWRNRLAHHECLLGNHLDYRYNEMMRIAGYIDPAAETWLKERSAMLEILKLRP